MTNRGIKLGLLFGFVLSVGVCGVIMAQEEKDADRKKSQDKEIAWYDMEECEICKNFAAMKHSMHKIKWETHLLDDGMISVAIVPEDMKEDMEKAKASMQQTVAKLTQGEQLDMCGHCQFMGHMMEMGAKFKELKTLGVDISIVTSDDPEVVKQIHAFAKKSKVEHEKMLKKIKAEKGN